MLKNEPQRGHPSPDFDAGIPSATSQKPETPLKPECPKHRPLDEGLVWVL